jgi:tRNA dimethylallyltransferase
MNNYGILLMGPTASGKTDLAVRLTREFPCDIISVDSAMVYRGMDIGTAKPSATVLAQAPHRLINILDPSQAYSAGQFCRDAKAEIEKIQTVGRIPLLVGGTMLYFHSFLHGLSELPLANPAIRQRLSAEAQQYGWASLHQRLTHFDPITAQRLHPHDQQRIQRALEIYEVSGMTMTEWYAEQALQAWVHPVIKLILAPAQRSILHVRIAQRFQAMLEQGLVEEVRGLMARGDLQADLPSMRCVGYRQTWQYLEGKFDYNTLVERGIIATRQLAKRQLTWLRGQQAVQWFDSEQPQVNELVISYLRNHAFFNRLK